MSLSGLVLRPLLLLALQALLPLARLPLDSQPSHRHRHISRPRWCFSTFLATYFVDSNNEKLYFPAGTVNTKMLLEGWGPCGIPLSQADDTFWQATSQEVSLRCDNLFASSKLSFFTNHGIFGSLIFPARATTTCLGKGEVEETTVRKKSKILWHFLSSALSLESESDDNPLNFSEEKRTTVWLRCNCV